MAATDRSYDETAVLEALLANGYGLEQAEAAEVVVHDEHEGAVIRVALEWRLTTEQAEQVLGDSVRFEANACS
jgi:hypothetical protein